jgi:ABC-type dipeptide/oligopeptide/nickel transport system ATPase component
MNSPLLEIRGLDLSYGEARILHGVGVEVGSGETVGLVGESGSGKSSTVRAALRLLPPSATVAGSVRINGRSVLDADDRALRDIRASEVGLIQQDPRGALNPVRRIGDSLTERLVRVHGVRLAEARRRGLDLLAAVGITRPEERLRQYPHELSGGMLQRIVIAAALTTEPRLLLADEATSALDVTTQAEVLSILRDQQRERDLGLLFITHDLHLAAAFCDRVCVMLHGTLVEELRGADLFRGATHPYTRALLAAAPAIGEEQA